MLSSHGRRVLSRRLSRRSLLKAAGLGASSLTLARCAGGSGENGPATDGDERDFLTPSGEPETPQYGGRLNAGTATVFSGLDPQLCVDCYAVGAKFHGYLFSVDLRSQSIDLQMAESFERIDELTYVWKLRPGIRFQNIDPTFGREVTAEDVVYSLSRRRDEPSGQNDKQLLRDYTTSFEATDKYTFRLQTSRPYAPAVDELGNPSYAIIPREAVEKWGDLRQNAVGCGAYILEEFVRGERVKMRKNPDFYMEGRPYIEYRDVLVIPDESTITQAFNTKQLDYYGGSQPNRMKVDQWKNIEGIVIRQGDNYWHRTFMLKVDRPPFNDVRVRKALDLALDRQDFIDKMAFGDGKVAGPIVPDLRPWSLPQEELREFYKLDLATAKQLLSAAGYEDGLDVELKVQNVADLSRLCEIAKGHLAKAGIRCTLNLQELGVHLAQTLYPGNFTMTCYYNLPYTEPDRPLCQWFSKGQAGISFSGYNSAEADEWIWKERSEFNLDKRVQIVHEAQRFFMREHGPQISTITDTGYGAYWEWLRGIDENLGRGSFLLLGVHEWLAPRS